MKVTQVLRIVADSLNAIQVPVGMNEQIARPIAEAIRNILICVKAQEKADVEYTARQKRQEEAEQAGRDTEEAENDGNTDAE